MSRIVTSLQCAGCGVEWEGYLNFGHPEHYFEYSWYCEECGAKNAVLIEGWNPSNDLENTVRIYRNRDDTVKIFLDMFHTQKFFGLNYFDWRESEDRQIEECDNAYLLLSDISEQLLEQFKGLLPGVLFVWLETAANGAIYQFDGFRGAKWYLHGNTTGHEGKSWNSGLTQQR